MYFLFLEPIQQKGNFKGEMAGPRGEGPGMKSVSQVENKSWLEPNTSAGAGAPGDLVGLDPCRGRCANQRRLCRRRLSCEADLYMLGPC